MPQLFDWLKQIFSGSPGYHLRIDPVAVVGLPMLPTDQYMFKIHRPDDLRNEGTASPVRCDDKSTAIESEADIFFTDRVNNIVYVKVSPQFAYIWSQARFKGVYRWSLYNVTQDIMVVSKQPMIKAFGKPRGMK